MHLKYTLLAGAAVAAPSFAGDLKLNVEIPQLTVAEYHKPYVAIWIESPEQKFVQNLAVWYDTKKKDNEGTKWLKDMRQWWRKSGRELTMPVDGVSGASRAPGEQQITFSGTKAPLSALAAGSYHLVIEAAREVGGRELIRVPFEWPAKAAQNVTAKGEHELGKIALNVQP